MSGGVEIRLTGARADVEALADALTRHGQPFGLVVVEASGWYPNRPRRPRASQRAGGRRAGQSVGSGEACVGRVYLHTHPRTTV